MLIQITFGQWALVGRSATDASGPWSRRDWGPVRGVWAARGSSASLPKYLRYCIARTVLFWQYLHTLNTVTGNYGNILPIFDLPKNRNATVWLSRMWAVRTKYFYVCLEDLVWNIRPFLSSVCWTSAPSLISPLGDGRKIEAIWFRIRTQRPSEVWPELL